ncbi:MAG: hypothetical protein KDA79_01100 [Planctomycetaceae bacterium]|nr:hypothetical protein [Planctomycetaceae bacterium]
MAGQGEGDMESVCLAILWHQHQPYYPDDVSGETLMPWVRLHGTRDYYGMAMHLKEVPEFRCTINLVPSLLIQLQAYTRHGRSDRHLDISRIPADSLSSDEAIYLLSNFFMANAETMIRPWPRYRELLSKRAPERDTAEQALPRFSRTDLRDLQIWNNLVWIHELAFEQDSELRAFRARGAGWTEGDKNWLLGRQLEILGQVIPLHRELARTGQVELTTTPFYHPILPLLQDRRSARQAMPGCALPAHLSSWPDDITTHIERAVQLHEDLFGTPPRGMWPSEGSVSQEIIPAIAQAGIQWIATDEEILAESTGGWVSRDASGNLRHPEMLYRPWKLEQDGASLQIVFRDHVLSDLIGFHYQRTDPAQAADDLLGRVETIGRQVSGSNAGRPALVPVILDGENCWEYYPDGGVEFLRTLYRRAAASQQIEPVTIGEYLEHHPPVDHIGKLFAGSWISHNFAIWIGHEEDNQAWDRLHETREFLVQAASDPQASPQLLKRAWEELYIAEGSDWFWWFGDDHNSDQDGLFDQLFRRHLQNVYQLLNQPVPQNLLLPITRSERKSLHTSPSAFLPVKVDGRTNYFEWIAAGRYVSGSERGTMTLVSDGLIREICFGFDQHRLLVRVDTASQAIRDLASAGEVQLCLMGPGSRTIRLTGFDGQTTDLRASLFHRDEPAAELPATNVEAAVDRILEIGVPFQTLEAAPGTQLGMYLEVLSAGKSIDRAPREGTLAVIVPPPDFEQLMWQA